jgi:hypothetical protein
MLSEVIADATQLHFSFPVHVVRKALNEMIAGDLCSVIGDLGPVLSPEFRDDTQIGSSGGPRAPTSQTILRRIGPDLEGYVSPKFED